VFALARGEMTKADIAIFVRKRAVNLAIPPGS
jgi:hypothetical protein